MREWVELWVDDAATPEQARAVERLVELALPSFASWGIVSTERVPLTVERTATSLAFGVPAARVEMDVMTGRDGAAIRVENLAAFPGYVQHRSRVNRHAGSGRDFEYSGTSGFTARFSAGG